MRKAIAAALLVLTSLVLTWYLTRDPGDALPSTDPAAVAAIVVEKHDIPGELTAFTVDTADHALVLRLFEGGVIDRHPLPWVVGERVVITYRDGRTASIQLFRTGRGQGAYHIRRGYYRGSSDEEIAEVLATCKARAAARSAG